MGNLGIPAAAASTLLPYFQYCRERKDEKTWEYLLLPPPPLCFFTFNMAGTFTSATSSSCASVFINATRFLLQVFALFYISGFWVLD